MNSYAVFRTPSALEKEADEAFYKIFPIIGRLIEEFRVQQNDFLYQYLVSKSKDGIVEKKERVLKARLLVDSEAVNKFAYPDNMIAKGAQVVKEDKSGAFLDIMLANFSDAFRRCYRNGKYKAKLKLSHLKEINVILKACLDKILADLYRDCQINGLHKQESEVLGLVNAAKSIKRHLLTEKDLKSNSTGDCFVDKLFKLVQTALALRKRVSGVSEKRSSETVSVATSSAVKHKVKKSESEAKSGKSVKLARQSLSGKYIKNSLFVQVPDEKKAFKKSQTFQKKREDILVSRFQELLEKVMMVRGLTVALQSNVPKVTQ